MLVRVRSTVIAILVVLWGACWPSLFRHALGWWRSTNKQFNSPWLLRIVAAFLRLRDLAQLYHSNLPNRVQVPSTDSYLRSTDTYVVSS